MYEFSLTIQKLFSVCVCVLKGDLRPNHDSVVLV